QARCDHQAEEDASRAAFACVGFLRCRIAALPEDSEWLFPGGVEGEPIEDVRRLWGGGQKKAGVQRGPIPGLRHTILSPLISGGASLPVVSKLSATPRPRPRNATRAYSTISFGRGLMPWATDQRAAASPRQ